MQVVHLKSWRFRIFYHIAHWNWRGNPVHACLVYVSSYLEGSPLQKDICIVRYTGIALTCLHSVPPTSTLLFVVWQWLKYVHCHSACWVGYLLYLLCLRTCIRTQYRVPACVYTSPINVMLQSKSLSHVLVPHPSLLLLHPAFLSWHLNFRCQDYLYFNQQGLIWKYWAVT